MLNDQNTSLCECRNEFALDIVVFIKFIQLILFFKHVVTKILAKNEKKPNNFLTDAFSP